MITLHYYPGNASFAPHVCLTKIGAPFRLDLVDRATNAQRSPAYTALNPNQRIPTLVADGPDEDLVLWEAAAICLYLADRYPEAALMPTVGTTDRAEAYKYLIFLTNTLQPEILIFSYPDRHVTDPDAAPLARGKAAERIARWLTVLDDAVGDRTYLVGDQPTVVDYYALMLARWTRRLDKKASDYPHLGPYYANLLTLPEVRQTIVAEGLDPAAYVTA